MNTQKRLNMNIGYYTKTLRDDLRKGLLITLTLLFVCPGVWGQGSEPVTWTEVRTLEELQAALQTGGYIQFQSNISFNTEISVNHDATIDLNNYALIRTKIGWADNAYYSYTYGYIKIGTTSPSEVSLSIVDNSNAKQGKINGASDDDIRYSTYNRATTLPLIENNGHLTIENITITRHLIDNAGYATIENKSGATLTFKSGTITSTIRGIHNHGTLNIEGGTISSCSNYGIYNETDATLNLKGDPTITNNTNNSGSNVYLASNTVINVNGTLSNTTPIGITMADLETYPEKIFTTNLSGNGTIANFVSDKPSNIGVFDNSSEAKLQTWWNWLQVQMTINEANIEIDKNIQPYTSDAGGLEVPSGKTVTLDLNGTIDRKLTTATANGYVIKNSGKLTIKNNAGTGVIKGGYAQDAGGGIYNEGILALQGGTIQNNKANSGYGGGIYNSGTGVLTVTGGTISSNTALKGGGIYNAGTLTFTDGTISNNNVTSNTASFTSAIDGGGIYNAGTMTISGGSITNNTVYTGKGAGIYHDGTSFTLSGAPNISGNKKGTLNSGSNTNIYLTATRTITIDGTLSYSTPISISMANRGVFTSGLNWDGSTSAKFSSEESLVDVYSDAGEAKLQTHWGHLQEMMREGGPITLARNYQPHSEDVGGLVVPSGKTVILNLNGRDINRNVGSTAIPDGYVIKVENGGSLTISGTGTIRGGNNSGNGGCILNEGTLELQSGNISSNSAVNGGGIYNTGALTISGGNVQSNTASTGHGGGIYHAGTSLTISNGNVQSNTASAGNGGGIYNDEAGLTVSDGNISSNTANTGGGIYNNTGKSMTINGGTIQNNITSTDGYGGGIYNYGTLTISGGSITGNGYSSNTVYVAKGGGIYNCGTLNISGGTIQTNKATASGGGIYQGGTINMSGNPTVTSNSVSNAANNVYLPSGVKININAGLTTANVGITMEDTYGEFTSGLTSHAGDYQNFSADASTSVWRKETPSTQEAQLISYWAHVQELIDLAGTTATTISLENKTYEAQSTGTYTDTYLHIASTQNITLDLKGRTLNRNLSSLIPEGCVIFNEGTLTIKNTTGNGYIQGGNNDNTGNTKGGGICNTGTLTIESGVIRNNASVDGGGIYNTGIMTISGGTITSNAATAHGGGIYHNNTTANSFNLQGIPSIANNTVNNAANNVYLETDNIITITGSLTNTSGTTTQKANIGISYATSPYVFTSGLNGNGDASHFVADESTWGIGLKSDGEAIVGQTYNITRAATSTYVHIQGDYSTSPIKAVPGEHIKVYVTVSGGLVPVSLTYSGGVTEPAPTYPKVGNGTTNTYTFTMPASDVTITAVSRSGGYCGAGSTSADIEKMKYYINNGWLTFVTENDENCQMGTTRPWSNKSYTALSISNHVTNICAYAFSGSGLSTAVTIPASVTTIGERAFYGSGITSVDIPSTVTDIGTFAFGNCTHLTSIIVDGGNAYYSSSNDVLYKKEDSTPRQLICYPAGNTTPDTYQLPSTITSIADGAFAYNTSLQTITVEAGNENFQAIDGVLFMGATGAPTQLVCYPAGNTAKTYTIPTTVTTISPYAFHSCSTLTHIYLHHTANVPAGGVSMFDNTTCNFMVASSLRATYLSAAYWSSYTQSRFYSMDVTGATIELEPGEGGYYDYQGPHPNSNQPITPAVTVTYAGLTLTKDEDYTVAYTNNDAVGTATVTITGAGIYDNTLTKSVNFTITRKVVFSPVSNQRYATYYPSENLNSPNGTSEPHAYTITNVKWSNRTVQTSSELSYLPENTPILFECTAYTSYTTFHLTAYTGATSSVTYDSEHFKGIEDTPKALNELLTKNDASAIYMLNANGFYRAASGTLPARRCYIVRKSTDPALPPSSAPSYLDVILGDVDQTTGIIKIDDLETNDAPSGNDIWYSLEGRRLQGKPTVKGIYIHNGRKVVVK